MLSKNKKNPCPDVTKYVEYVNNNIDKIADYVDQQFYETKESIKTKLIQELRSYLTPKPEHYVFKPTNCFRDYSGEIVEDGTISLNQTVREFLENEYTGGKTATYISGMGWHYKTYEDELSDYTIELATDIMFPAIRKCIEQHFNGKLSDEKYELVKEKCYDFDEIYDNSLASGFFYCQPAIEFTGIGEMKLTDIMANKSKED